MEQERSIAVAIKNLSNQFRRYMASVELQLHTNAGKKERVTDIQGRIISYIYANQNQGVVFQKDLEQHFNIRRSTATTILKRIERNGFISRETYRNDARMKVITLTEKAKYLCPMAHDEIVKAEKQVAKGLSQDEAKRGRRINVSENMSFLLV